LLPHHEEAPDLDHISAREDFLHYPLMVAYAIRAGYRSYEKGAKPLFKQIKRRTRKQFKERKKWGNR
jgi:hypothetical protein